MLGVETVVAFLLGLGAGIVIMAPLLMLVSRRARRDLLQASEAAERELVELRQERADDRETNRRLRRELAVKTPTNYETVIDERDRALVGLDEAQTEAASLRLRADTLEIRVNQLTDELVERDRSLREARLAIHEIRLQLEEDRLLDAADVDGDDLRDGRGGTDDKAFEGYPLGEATAS